MPRQSATVNLDANDVTLQKQDLTLAASSADRIVYVDPAGDDDGNGTVSSPWATWDRAFEELPRELNHRLTLKAAAGTYTSFPLEIKSHLGPMGQLALECTDAPTVVSGPHTITTATAINTKSGWDILVAAAGWTPDEFYGKFLRMKTGSAAGMCWPIGWNTADTISLGWGRIDATISNGDTFEVIEPAATIEVDRAPVFNLTGAQAGRTYAQFLMCNLKFSTDLSYGATYDHYYPYRLKGNVGSLFGVVTFLGTSPVTTVLAVEAGSTNLGPAQWDNARGSGNLTDLEDEGLLMDPLGYYAAGSIQVLGSVTPPTGSKTWITFDASEGAEYGALMYSVSCRNGISSWCERSESNGSVIGWVYVDHNSRHGVKNCRIYGNGYTMYGLRVDDASYLDLSYVYVDKCGSDSIQVEEMSDVSTYSVTGSTADIGGYGMKVGAICRIVIDGCDITGTSGAIRLLQTAATVAYPAAGNTQTDNQGTYITAPA